jgi:hypothetical protein
MLRMRAAASLDSKVAGMPDELIFVQFPILARLGAPTPQTSDAALEGLQ